jgi:hypothetical protein
VAYFAPTYKDGYEWWNEIKHALHELIESKDEQVKQLRTVTGSLLDLWSMDDPNSGRGRKYHRVILDECEKAPKFKEAWQQTIRATLSDFQGDAWFLSTPKFGKTFFKEIARYHEKHDNWISWKFTTYDNPHIKPEEVDDARRQLDELTFKCEFLAEDVDLVSNPFCYAFNEHKHVRSLELNPYNFIRLSFDFNVDPITCVVSQYEDGVINILREFRLSNSDIYELCDRITATYPSAHFLITGDASGQNRSALTAGNINYYNVIQQKLNLNDGQLNVPTFNPSIADNRVLCNSILQNFPIYIDPSCTYLIEDLKYVEVKEDGDINKDKDKHRSHLLDAFRYTLNTWHRELLNIRILSDVSTH